MTISFSGLASGLDTSSWVESLVALKRAKVTTLQEQKENIITSKDTLSSIKSFFAAFRATLEKITDSKFNIPAMNLFAQNIATSANLKVLTATATDEAEEGTYRVKVDKIATATKATSKFNYMTTIVETTTATENTLLKHIGVKAGTIGVNVDGVTHSLNITNDDTIASFIEKLKEIGIDASFNNATGVFSVNLSAGDINDDLDGNGVKNTNIVDALHLTGVNEGYKTDEQLKIYTPGTVTNLAEGTTKLSELGVHAGEIEVEANGRTYVVNMTNATTIDNLVADLNSKNIDASFSNGIFTVSDAIIKDADNDTNFITAMGLTEDVYSKSQTTGALNYKTVSTEVTAADTTTKLSELGTVASGDKILITDSNNNVVEFNINQNTTIGDLITAMTNAGLHAEIEDGILKITGGKISKATGSTFDPITALGLKESSFTAMATGNPLTETIIEYEVVNYDTKLVDDLNVKEGYLKVTDANDTVHYLAINTGQTIGNLMSDLANIGIYSTLDTENGILEITGGEFETLQDSEVATLVGNGSIIPIPGVTQQGTDLLRCIFGSDAISAEQTAIASSYSRSRALTRSVTNTVNATEATTLGTLGLNGNNKTAVFNVRGELRTITVSKSTSIQDLMNALEAQGIESTWDEDFSRITINNATLTANGTSNLGDVLNLSTNIAGTYITSNALKAYETVNVEATRETTLEELGVTTNGNLSVVLNISDGTTRTFTVDKTTDLGTIIDTINGYGTAANASIVDGVFKIEGGYIVNPEIEAALGLQTSTVGHSNVLGTKVTHTIVTTATGESTLGDIIDELGTNAKVSGGYNLYFNSESLSVSSTTTLDSLIQQIHAKGGTTSIDSSGRFHVEGGTLTGTVAGALGFTSQTTTNSVSATGETLSTISTVFADSTTKLSAVGLGASTITVQGTDGVAVGTITTNADMTIGDVLTALAGYGISGTIKDGVINLDSDIGNYATGGVLQSMGVGTANTTFTTTAGVANTSSAVVSMTSTITADSSTTLSSLGLGASTITVSGINGDAVGTITTNADMTIGDVLTALAGYGISGTIKDGVINLDSDFGNYATGGVLQSMGVGTTPTTSTFTVQSTSTSSALVSSTYSITADSSTTLNSLGLGASTITVQGTDGVAVGTITTNADMTIGDVLTALAGYGISGTIKDGVINLDSDIGNYATGGVLQSMGVGTANTTFTTTAGVANTSSAVVSMTSTKTADSSTTLSSLGLGASTITVQGVDGVAVGTITTNADMTIGDVLTALAGYGISGTIKDGVINLDSDIGNYATGGVLQSMGVGTTATTSTTTAGVTNTSSNSIVVTNTGKIDGDTKLKDIVGVSIPASGNVITVNDTNGNKLGEITVNGENTVDEVLTALAGYDISGIVNANTGSITLFSEEGNVATGDLITQLGLTTVSGSTVITTTTGVKNTSTAVISSTYSVQASGSTKLSDLGIEAGELTITDANGTTVTTLSVTTGTDINTLMSTLAGYGIQGEINDGVITLNSTNGNYITGDIATALGIGTVAVTQTETAGVVNTSSAAVTYNTTAYTTTFSTVTENVTTTGSYTIPAGGGGTQTITITNTITTTEATTGTDTITVTHTFTVDGATTGTETITLTSTQTTTDPVLTTQTVYVTSTISTSYTLQVTETVAEAVTKTLTVNASDTIVVSSFADENTTFAQLDITDPNNLVVDIYWQGSIDENGSYTLTADSTIKDFISIIEDHTSGEISVNIENGVITIHNTEVLDWHVGGTVATALGISVVNEPNTNSSVASTEQVTYTTSTTSLQTTTLTIDTSATGYVTVQQFATEDTTLGELGITDAEDMELTVIGGFGSHIYDATTRLSTILMDISYDSNYKLNAEIVNGVIKITSSDDSYYVQGTLADALGIRTVTETVTIQTLSSTAALSFTDTIAATGTSTVGEIYEQRGLTFRTVLDTNTIYTTSNGSTKLSTFTMTATTTLDQIFEYLEGQGITGSIDENGVITLNSENGLYVGGYFFDQVLNTDTYRTISTIVVEPTTLVSRQAITYRAVATEDTTFAELGISGSNLVYELVRFQSGNFNTVKVTMTADNTIGDFLKSIDDKISYGCTLSGSIKNGKITITGTANANTCYYVQGALATALGIPDIAESVNSYTAASSTTLRETSYETLHWDTTVDDLGVMLYAAGYSNGQVFEVRNTGSSTVGEFLTELASYGFAVDLSGGKVSITNSENAFIGASNLNSGLALDNDDDASNGIVYANLQTVVTATSEPVYVNYYNTISTDDTLSDFSITSDQTITINSNGQNYTITIQPSDTFGDMFTQLASFGINASINDGTLKIQTTGESTWVSSSAALSLQLGLGTITTSTTIISATNTHSNNLVVDEVIEVNTNLIDENTTFAELGIEVGDIDFYIELIEGTDATTTLAIISSLTTESTIGDFINALNSVASNSDARATLENGVIKMNTNGVTFIHGPLAAQLGIKVLNDSTGNYSDIRNSDSKQLNYVIETLTTVVTPATATLNWDTTFAELQVTTPQTMTISSNGENHVIQIESTDSVGELLTQLASHGFEVALTNGQVSIESNNATIVAIDDPIKTALNLGEITTTTTNDTSNLDSKVLLYDKSITVDTTGTITVTEAQTKTISISTTMTSSTIVTHTIETTGTTGEYVTNTHTSTMTITVENTTTSPVTYTVSDTITIPTITLSEKIHSVVSSMTVEFPTTDPITVSITSTGTYERLAVTVTSATTSANLGYDTIFSQLGITDNQTISVFSGGTEYAVTIESTDSVGEMLTALAGLGIHGTIEDGKLTLKGDEDAYITHISDGLKDKLKLAAPTTTVNTSTVIVNDNSNELGYNTTKNMTTESTFASLGMTSDGTISVVSDGVAYTVDVKTDDTVGDLIATLAGLGIVGSVTDGKLSLQGDGQAYITGTTGLDCLKLDNDNNADTAIKYYTTSDHTVNQLYTTTNKTYSFSNTISTDDTFAELGLAANGTITIISDGTQQIVTVKTSDTVGDLFTKLASYGIAGYITDDYKLALKGDNEAYISGISENFRTQFYLSTTNYTTSTHTTTANTASDEQKYNTTNILTTDDTFGELGLGTGTITVVSNGTTTTIAVATGDTIDDILTQLASYGITGNVDGGKLTLTGSKDAYVLGITDALRANLKLGTTNYSTTTHTATTNTDSNEQGYSTTNTLTTDDTFAELGMTTTGYITLVSDGTQKIVTINTDHTVDDVISTLAGYGIAGSVENGRITLRGDAEAYITGVTSNVVTALKLGTTYSTAVQTTTANTASNEQKYNTTNTLTTDDTFGELGLGTGTITVVSNGTTTTIAVATGDTIDDILTQLASYGITGNVDGGKLTLTGSKDAYVLGITDALRANLKLGTTNYSTTTHTATTNTDSNEQKQTITAVATGTTLLSDLRNSAGNAPSGYTISLTTESNAGNTTTVKTFNTGDNVYDVIDWLASQGIDASIDSTGRFTAKSSTLTDFKIEGNLGTYLIDNSTKVYDEGSTNNISTNLVEETVVDVDDYTLLSKLGVTSGNIIIYDGGTEYTISINNSTTVGDFRAQLAEFGINSDIVEGKLLLLAEGKVYTKSVTGGSNILDIFGIDYNDGKWDLGNSGYSQISEYLNDTRTDVVEATMATKINELLDASGNPLNIQGGQIYVYQDGTRSAININVNDTLEDLASKLSQYGITVGISSEGRVYFDGNNNSYLTTQGISSGASDILTKIGVGGTWNTRLNSTSETLDYEVEDDVKVDGSTKLVDLQDSSGNSLGITTGSYYVYQNGVRTTESIDENTTVDDFLATMATYSISTDFDEDGSLAVGGNHATYLATSDIGGVQNTNLISTLFTRWDFTNVYTTNHIEKPIDVTVAITETTKLADINETPDIFDETVPATGTITVIKDGVKTDIELNNLDTVGDLMDELALFGFESVINGNGQLIITNTGDSSLEAAVGSKGADILELFGIAQGDWISTNKYEGTPLELVTTTTSYVSATRETLISELTNSVGTNLNIGTGEFYIYKDGVKYTSYISSDETLGSLMEKLESFGIQTTLADTASGTKLSIEGSGNCYVANSNAVGAPQIVGKLFVGGADENYSYSGIQQTTMSITTTAVATETTLLNEISNRDTSKQLDGTIAVEINGVTNYVSIGANETIGGLLNKFNALGLEATLADGNIVIQSGYDLINTIAPSGTDASEVLEALGIEFVTDLGGYAASSVETEQTTTLIEDRTFSVANYADSNTQMKLLNISDGTLTLYRDGQRTTVSVLADETFGQLEDRIQDTFGDVKISFNNGYLTFESTNPAVSVDVGATTDTSNFSAITGITSDGSGKVRSARELYCVNETSLITSSNIFRRGDVTEGTFVIGTATFTVDSTTSLSSLISQINSTVESNAIAFWDTVDGKLVITSRSTGAALVNIEAGTSNFTEIMGLTTTKDANGNTVASRMVVEAQEVGENARFSINGTYYTSTSNNIGSDVSRIKGVTINLKGVSEGEEVELKIERDKETVATAVSEVVDAYNELISNIDKEIAKDAPLHDQTTLKLIRNQIRNMMTNSISGLGSLKNLAAVGISVDKAVAGNIETDRIDVLTFDKNKFIEAFEADRFAVQNLLVGTDGNLGIFRNLEENILEKSAEYFFTNADRSYNNQISRLDEKIKRANREVERYKERLEAKFASMDLLISKMQNQYSSFLGS